MIIHSARDLNIAVRGLRPDAERAGITITDAWCRDQMHSLGVSRYESVPERLIALIARRVDSLVPETD